MYEEMMDVHKFSVCIIIIPRGTSPDQTPSNPQPTYAELLEEVNELWKEKEYLLKQLDSATTKLQKAIKIDHETK